jgi:hypothetical protein
MPIFQNASPEPLSDQSQDSQIGDPVRHHPHQPLVIYRVEELANVGVENPAHALRHHRRMECRQRLVRIPPGPKPVREPEEVNLIDGAQNLGHRALDDLVL